MPVILATAKGYKKEYSIPGCLVKNVRFCLKRTEEGIQIVELLSSNGMVLSSNPCSGKMG
jgi:hypothetical protein